jgi:putative ABC transport system ATP-binding protein
MTPVLHGTGLTRSYGATPALRGVDITVGEGEIVAITGPSGCGKSTLLHCLSGIMPVDQGRVLFRGEDIAGWSEARRSTLRRTRFGILFQFGQLVPELTAAENVALPLLLGGARRRAARTQALEWLDRFGVAGEAARQPGEMSGGQQQRCALARAMVTTPAVLFADEPTGALDVRTGEQVLTEIVQVARAERMAVVLITHETQIAAYADREVMLRDGVVDPTGLGLGSLR